MWTAARTAVQGRPLGTRLTCHTPPHLQARTDTSATSEGDDTVNEFTSVHVEPAFLIFKSSETDAICCNVDCVTSSAQLGVQPLPF